MATALDPRIAADLGPTWTGQSAAFTGKLVGMDGTVLVSDATFDEPDTGSGSFRCTTPTDTSWVGTFYYDGTGLSPPIPRLPSDPIGPAVQVDTTQVVPLDSPLGSIGEALLAARADGFGSWVLDKTAKTITLYAPDKTTILWVFDLDSVSAPLARTAR